MLESEAAAVRSDDREEDDCPLCLEPLPPFWDRQRRVPLICCGKHVCKDCRDKKIALVERAIAEGSYGKEEEQLDCCPFCRTNIEVGDMAKVLEQQFNNGRLPLSLYCELGKYYLKGEYGVERNVEKGVEVLRLGAEKGDPDCQFYMGGAYLEGDWGVSQCLIEAKRWHLAAAEQGHAIAEYNLACMLRDEGNDAGYLQHMRSSASNGYDEACHTLGLDHYKGLCGAEKSIEEAIRVVMPAAERGHAKSMKLCGGFLCTGVGLLPSDNPNFTKGMHFLRRAAATGDESAIKSLDGLEKIVSSMCFRCNKKAPQDNKFLRCAKCRAAWYCSKDCQVQHWKAKEGGHKQVCIKWE